MWKIFFGYVLFFGLENQSRLYRISPSLVKNQNIAAILCRYL